MGGLVSEITPGAQNLHIELWEFSGSADLGGGVILTGHGVGRYKAADITITGQDTTTRIVIQQEGSTFSTELEAIMHEIKHTAMWARDLHRDSQKMTGERLIERYYRSKAHGTKITLRELAEQHGFNPAYLREAKRKYDQAGKWGTKPRKKK